MALVNVVTIKVTDFDNKSKTLNLFYPAATSVATMQTDTDSFIAALDDVIDGQVTDVTVQVQLTLPSGIKSTPTAGNTVRNGTAASFDAANTTYGHGLFIPSVSNSHYVGTLIDTTDAAVTDLFDEVIGSYNKYGDVIIGFLGGEKSTRK